MEIVSPEQRPNVSELVKCILNMASSLKALVIIPNCQKPRLLYYVPEITAFVGYNVTGSWNLESERYFRDYQVLKVRKMSHN